MDPILYFPIEITNHIMEQISLSELLTNKTVSKQWQAFMDEPFLKNLTLSIYFPEISTAEYPSLNDRFISSIDHHVIDRIRKFSVQIDKNQTGLFSIVFPFSPQCEFQVKMGRNLKRTDVFTNADKKEILIFQEKLLSVRNIYPFTEVLDYPCVHYKLQLSKEFWDKHVKRERVNTGGVELAIEGFHKLYSELITYFQKSEEQ